MLKRSRYTFSVVNALHVVLKLKQEMPRIVVPDLLEQAEVKERKRRIKG